MLRSTKRWQGDAALYAKTHLISVSFDPTYDTPAVLKSYGGAYTGKYVDERFEHWDFAAPLVKELAEMTEFFDVGDNAGREQVAHALAFDGVDWERWQSGGMVSERTTGSQVRWWLP